MANGEGTMLIDAPKPEVKDGAQLTKEKRKRTRMIFASLLALYIFGGWILYYLMEGWNFGEFLVFILSVLTGVGYGHIAPVSVFGKLLTSLFILAGLVLFASMAGEILYFIMEVELTAVLSAVKDYAEGDHEAARKTYQEKIQDQKRHQFFVGLINICVIMSLALLIITIWFGEDIVDAIYLSSISVLKLDSACLFDAVPCNHQGNSPGWLVFTILWSILTYGVVGHFLVSASAYLSTGPEASISRLNHIDAARFQRIDVDKDGRISRSEFLADRLVQDGIADREAIDAILRNFDRLDRDGSGRISASDLA